VVLLRLVRPWTGPTAMLSLAAITDPAVEGAQVRVGGFGTTERRAPLDPMTPLERFERADGNGELFAGSARLLEATVETITTANCAAR